MLLCMKIVSNPRFRCFTGYINLRGFTLRPMEFQNFWDKRLKFESEEVSKWVYSTQLKRSFKQATIKPENNHAANLTQGAAA